MNRWKIAGAAAICGAGAAAVVLIAPAIQGQEKPTPAPKEYAELAVRASTWFGGQIGVTVRDASPGVAVEEVRRNSPAEQAGIKEGDTITEVDGERVRSARQFSRLVDESPVGKPVRMALQRAGQRTSVEVTPAPRQFGRIAPVPFERFKWDAPDIPSMPEWRRDFDLRVMPEIGRFATHGRLGVQLQDVDGQLAEYFGVKQGALVTAVAKDTPAERAGIKAGDVITAVAGEQVEDTADVKREVRRMDDDREYSVELIRERKPVSVKVKLEAAKPPTPGTRTESF